MAPEIQKRRLARTMARAKGMKRRPGPRRKATRLPTIGANKPTAGASIKAGRPGPPGSGIELY